MALRKLLDMKKWEIILLWVGGLWTVVCLVEVANRGRWSTGLALMLAGWLVCGLVWVSLKKWPKQGNVPTNETPANPRGTKPRVPIILVVTLSYVLAVVFLGGWINARTQISKERIAIKRIADGNFQLSDCKVLPEPQATRCIERRLGFVPDNPKGSVFDVVSDEMEYKRDNVKAILGTQSPAKAQGRFVVEEPKRLDFEPIK